MVFLVSLQALKVSDGKWGNILEVSMGKVCWSWATRDGGGGLEFLAWQAEG